MKTSRVKILVILAIVTSFVSMIGLRAACADDTKELKHIFQAAYEANWDEAHKAFSETACSNKRDSDCELDYKDDSGTLKGFSRDQVHGALTRLEEYFKKCDSLLKAADDERFSPSRHSRLDDDLSKCTVTNSPLKYAQEMSGVDFQKRNKKYEDAYAVLVASREKNLADREARYEDEKRKVAADAASPEGISTKLCNGRRLISFYQDQMKKERQAGEISGYVDAAKLHSLGQRIQADTEVMQNLKKAYSKALKGKTWTASQCK